MTFPILMLAAAAAGANVADNENRDTIIVNGKLDDASEGRESYTVRSMRTATRLPLSIRETPQSVTVITRQRLDDQQMTNITDVVRLTPGLYLNTSNGPGRPAFNARGFDIDNIMYDGIPSRYQGHVVGLQTNLAIFDRVEVVRGATGLITGSGNPSAAINMVRKRPQHEFSLGLTGAAGSWDNYRGEIDVGGPITTDGRLRARAVGSYQDSSTFRDGEVVRRGIGYGIVEYDLTPSTLLMAGASYQDDFYNSFWGGLPLSATGQHLDLPRSFRPSSDWEGKKQKATTAFGEIRQDIGKWQLRLTAMKTWQDAVFSGTYIYRRDADASLTQSLYQASYDEDQSGLDAYLSGPVTVLGRAQDLVFGASRRETKTRTQNYTPSGVPANYTIPDLFTFDPAALPRPNFQPTTASTNIITQYGLYASVRLNPADPLKIILGGRLDWFDYDNVGTVTGDYRVNANKTVYAGVLIDLDRHHTAYASYTDIFQPQSAKGFAADIASQSILPPIMGKNYEVGLKGEYLDGRLNATLSLFRVDQTNRAIVPADQTGCPTRASGISCSAASGLVRSQGFDAELQGELSPGLQVSLGYSHVRIRYKEGRSQTDGTNRFDTDYPEHIVKLSSTYALPGQWKGLRLGGALSWQSRIYNENLGLSNFPGVHFTVAQDSYALLDLFASYSVNEHLDLQVNINNFFDKSYYKAVGYDIRWGSTDAYGEPRNIMATIRYKM